MNYEPLDSYWLYHIRDSDNSYGPGHDGYIGITDNPQRRKKQHFDALAKGRHRNEKLQAAYDAAPHRFKFWLLTSGPRETIEARERLFVPKRDHLLNKQVGGGRNRGMSKEDAIRMTCGGSDAAETCVQRAQPSGASGDGTAAGCAERDSGAKHDTRDYASAPRDSSDDKNGRTSNNFNASDAHGETRGHARAGGKAAAGILGLIGDAVAGASVVAAAAASGLGTAYAISKHVFNDDESLDHDERDARKSGRTGSFMGGATGAAATIAVVCCVGEVGLGAAGVSTGLAGIGTVVGGGAAVGAVIALAAPAFAALALAGAGYGLRKLYTKLKK
ncbi:Uncharacterised protein [Burkholderia pseudomallei]|uniref:GIY-YIG nuclease family protein n=1 Tax=Burkholderia pseudomallei TaxID=28450 RepID=UPI000F282DFD|nr:GIY-YIG nuclease family protein [Burkholderia pseudomallei]CAJ7239719.1 Uncharacterised protein [Burkholderia pseudomallei]VBC15381.1 Uncharacterised protein [Burkholderia pseudomallei]VBS98672.1 Uncharacterised protein [Burkholderia pseudomallei]